MNQRLASIIISALSAVAAILITFAPVSDAKADSWFSLSGGASYNYFYDNPMSQEYRAEMTWMGGLIDIHPEYHFTDWFALGIDLSLGAQRGRGKVWVDGIWSKKPSALASEELLTLRFGIPFEHLDLWLELGAGMYALASNYIDEENEYNDTIYGDFRGLIGVTVKISDELGLGIHAGASYILFNAFLVNGGIHFQYNF